MDGSQTLYLEEIDEHYHSTFGAIQESQHVFIMEGLERCLAKEISLLEIGFGTGLNCYLTLLNCQKRDQNVSYYSVEKNPLPEELWDQLNYSLPFQDNNAEFFKLLHKAAWNVVVAINDQFSICKIECDVLQYDFIDLPMIDLVYFDAFSPDKQPELSCYLPNSPLDTDKNHNPHTFRKDYHHPVPFYGWSLLNNPTRLVYY